MISSPSCQEMLHDVWAGTGSHSTSLLFANEDLQNQENATGHEQVMKLYSSKCCQVCGRVETTRLCNRIEWAQISKVGQYKQQP